MIRLRSLRLFPSCGALVSLPSGARRLVLTVNAHSYNVACRDARFASALLGCDVLLPDGWSVVWAQRLLGVASAPAERVAGWDYFAFEMSRLRAGQTVMFLGSTERVLALIRERVEREHAGVRVVTYSPPFRQAKPAATLSPAIPTAFTAADTAAMVAAINAAKPDLLWIGMTAPKQELWAYSVWDSLKVCCPCGCVGAVFDFYAGTLRRAPVWWQRHGLEWAYRLLREPRRMWRRYVIGNVRFAWAVLAQLAMSK